MPAVEIQINYFKISVLFFETVNQFNNRSLVY